MDRTTDHGAARVRRILREMDPEGDFRRKTGTGHLDVFPAPASPRGTHRCLQCHGRLAVHQPDLRHHDRLLGVCKACAMWWLLERTTDEARWLMVPLPTGDEVRAAAPADPRDRPPAAS